VNPDEEQNLNAVNVESTGIPLEPLVPTHEENKQKLADTLHKRELVPRLRTYQGDVAEFIQSKDQSLTDVVLKEHEKKEKQKFDERMVERLGTLKTVAPSTEKINILQKEKRNEEAVRAEPKPEVLPRPEPEQSKNVREQIHEPVFVPALTPVSAPMPVRESLSQAIDRERAEDEAKIIKPRSAAPTNVLIYVTSLILLVGAVASGAYFLVIKSSQEPIMVTSHENILPVNNVAVTDFASLTASTIGETFESIRNNAEYREGITAVEITDSSKKTQVSATEFTDKLELGMPSALLRSLAPGFMLGIYDESQSTNFFLIYKVKDYGIAFRDMLEWEKQMLNDFAPFFGESALGSNATTPIQNLGEQVFKDVIVRNKDTRAAFSPSGKIVMIYTYLDKQTILITESENAIRGLVDAYVAGSRVR
jgi:hypothetical protein